MQKRPTHEVEGFTRQSWGGLLSIFQEVVGDRHAYIPSACPGACRFYWQKGAGERQHYKTSSSPMVPSQHCFPSNGVINLWMMILAFHYSTDCSLLKAQFQRILNAPLSRICWTTTTFCYINPSLLIVADVWRILLLSSRDNFFLWGKLAILRSHSVAWQEWDKIHWWGLSRQTLKEIHKKTRKVNFRYNSH